MSHAPHVGDAADNSRLIEDFGLRIGRAMGWPPMAGRLAGTLMLSPAPMTLSELQQSLGASKGSTSETTRLLMTHGTVERVKLPGVRQAVYEWRDDAWVGCLQYQLDQTSQLLDLARTAQDRGSRLTSAQQSRLFDMRSYYEFMAEQLQRLLDDYKRQLAVGKG